MWIRKCFSGYLTVCSRYLTSGKNQVKIWKLTIDLGILNYLCIIHYKIMPTLNAVIFTTSLINNGIILNKFKN